MISSKGFQQHFSIASKLVFCGNHLKGLMCKEAYMKGETCASSIVEDLLDEFRRGTGLHRKVNLGARLKMDFQYILLHCKYVQ